MALILFCSECRKHGFRECAEYNGLCTEHYIENLEAVICANNQRIKELEDKLAKCQDIAMGLGIKYNEQQDKLKIAASALKRVDNIAYEIDNKEINDIACTALEQLGELK